MAAIDFGNKQGGNHGTDRESGKIGPRYTANFDARKAQVPDPGRGDDRQPDHNGVANQRHVDSERK